MYTVSLCTVLICVYIYSSCLDYFVLSLFIFWLSIKCSIGKENAKVVKLLLLANFFSFFFLVVAVAGGSVSLHHVKVKQYHNQRLLFLVPCLSLGRLVP